MNDETDETRTAERKARRLLWWATVLAFVSITVCALDVMIKNQILAQAKESQGWIDRLRTDVDTRGHNGTGPGSPADPAGGPAGDADGPHLAGVDGAGPGRPAGPAADAGG
jgi:hypothetical protein